MTKTRIAARSPIFPPSPSPSPSSTTTSPLSTPPSSPELHRQSRQLFGPDSFVYSLESRKTSRGYYNLRTRNDSMDPSYSPENTKVKQPKQSTALQSQQGKHTPHPKLNLKLGTRLQEIAAQDAMETASNASSSGNSSDSSTTLPATTSSSTRAYLPTLEDLSYMPSAETNFEFKFPSPSGRSAAQLNKLFKLPPKFKEPENPWIKFSCPCFGDKPELGMAHKCLLQIEAKQKEVLEEIEEERKAKAVEKGEIEEDDDEGEEEVEEAEKEDEEEEEDG